MTEEISNVLDTDVYQETRIALSRTISDINTLLKCSEIDGKRLIDLIKNRLNSSSFDSANLIVGCTHNVKIDFELFNGYYKTVPDCDKGTFKQVLLEKFREFEKS